MPITPYQQQTDPAGPVQQPQVTPDMVGGGAEQGLMNIGQMFAQFGEQQQSRADVISSTAAMVRFRQQADSELARLSTETNLLADPRASEKFAGHLGDLGGRVGEEYEMSQKARLQFDQARANYTSQLTHSLQKSAEQEQFKLLQIGINNTVNETARIVADNPHALQGAIASTGQMAEHFGVTLTPSQRATMVQWANKTHINAALNGSLQRAAQAGNFQEPLKILADNANHLTEQELWKHRMQIAQVMKAGRPEEDEMTKAFRAYEVGERKLGREPTSAGYAQVAAAVGRGTRARFEAGQAAIGKGEAEVQMLAGEPAGSPPPALGQTGIDQAKKAWAVAVKQNAPSETVNARLMDVAKASRAFNPGGESVGQIGRRLGLPAEKQAEMIGLQIADLSDPVSQGLAADRNRLPDSDVGIFMDAFKKQIGAKTEKGADGVERFVAPGISQSPAHMVGAFLELRDNERLDPGEAKKISSAFDQARALPVKGEKVPLDIPDAPPAAPGTGLAERAKNLGLVGSLQALVYRSGMPLAPQAGAEALQAKAEIQSAFDETVKVLTSTAKGARTNQDYLAVRKALGEPAGFFTTADKTVNSLRIMDKALMERARLLTQQTNLSTAKEADINRLSEHLLSINNLRARIAYPHVFISEKEAASAMNNGMLVPGMQFRLSTDPKDGARIVPGGKR